MRTAILRLGGGLGHPTRVRIRPSDPVVSLLLGSRRPGLLRSLVILITSLAASGCGEQSRCEPGLCPVGTRCDAATGQCAAVAPGAGAIPRLSGHYALVGLGDTGYGVVGYAPALRSVVLIERDGDKAEVSYVAGEATEDGIPAGDAVDAFAAEGVVHVAWVRRSDDTLWYGRRDAEGWTREQVVAIAPRRPGDRLAIRLWNGLPTIAVDELGTGRLHVAVRAVDGSWTVEEVPLPPDVDGRVARVGGTLVASTFGPSITLAFYEPGGGDLVVATRSASWVVSRLVGRASDGVSDGIDAGRPCALTRDTKAGLVVAYRDRSGNAVRLLRSAAGAATDQLVDDGAYAVAATGAVRRAFVGTALDVVRLANGALAVAWQDASNVRIRLAVEAAGGALKQVTLPPSVRAQVRPRLLAQADGALRLTWLEPDPAGAGSRLASVRWTPLGGAE